MSKKLKYIKLLKNSKLLVLAILLIIGASTWLVGMPNKSDNFTARVAAASACPGSVSFGTSTLSADVKTAGEYKVWSRLQIPATNNSFYLKINSTCYKVIGTNLPSNQWGWISFENGQTGTPIKQNLSTGTHSISLISNERNVKVDRIILTTGSCVPDPKGKGDDCAVPIDSAPTITLESPTNGAKITAVTRVAATAVDDDKISKVDFFIDNASTPFKSISAAPYSFDWDPRKLSNGQHKITARAYDSAGQTASASAIVDIQIAPLTPTGKVYIAVPSDSDTVFGKDVIMSAGTSNLSGVNKVEFFLNDNLNLGAAAPTNYGWIINWDSTLVGNGSHKLVAKATSGSEVTSSTPVNIVVSNSGDNIPPSTPSNLRLARSTSKDSAKITWGASKDNAPGTIRYFVYLNDELKSQQTDTSRTFYNLKSGTSYVTKVVAVDVAGNQSAPATITFKTKSFCTFRSFCF